MDKKDKQEGTEGSEALLAFAIHLAGLLQQTQDGNALEDRDLCSYLLSSSFFNPK